MEFKWFKSLAAQGEIYLDCMDQYWYPRVFPRKNKATEQEGKIYIVGGGRHCFP